MKTVYIEIYPRDILQSRQKRLLPLKQNNIFFLDVKHREGKNFKALEVCSFIGAYSTVALSIRKVLIRTKLRNSQNILGQFPPETKIRDSEMAEYLKAQEALSKISKLTANIRR
jgi:hypothetical protein